MFCDRDFDNIRLSLHTLDECGHGGMVFVESFDGHELLGTRIKCQVYLAHTALAYFSNTVVMTKRVPFSIIYNSVSKYTHIKRADALCDIIMAFSAGQSTGQNTKESTLEALLY